MSPAPLVLLTRGSALARWQAEAVAGWLGERGQPVELRVVRTEGDRDRATPLASFGGVGIFTKALQERLLAGEGDLAVHSLKDLPSATVDGLVLAACPARGPVEDVLVSPGGAGPEALGEGARVGTSSPRRRAWLQALRPDLRVVDLRGNVPTRKGRAGGGDLDAVVLARAGLERLGLMDEDCHVLDPTWMVPAPCQGILGIECREGSAAAEVVAGIDEPAVRARATAERSLMRALDAGCTTPVGGLAELEGGELRLRARLAVEAGTVDFEARGQEPVDLGARVARGLRQAVAGLTSPRA